MRGMCVPRLALALTLTVACASSGPAPARHDASPALGSATIARIYYWRARPGKLDEYTRYIRDVAEPIDAEAQRRGAFLSVTTYVARDTLSPWTHMRVFLLRDSAQLTGLTAALDSAGMRLEPNADARRARGTYAATLRDRVGDATVDVLR
jgi:hypothetical protein